MTSHSPDLLDDVSLAPEMLLAVSAAGGATNIGPLDDAGVEALRTNLYTPGELLRMDQLTSDDYWNEYTRGDRLSSRNGHRR